MSVFSSVRACASYFNRPFERIASNYKIYRGDAIEKINLILKEKDFFAASKEFERLEREVEEGKSPLQALRDNLIKVYEGQGKRLELKEVRNAYDKAKKEYSSVLLNLSRFERVVFSIIKFFSALVGRPFFKLDALPNLEDGVKFSSSPAEYNQAHAVNFGQLVVQNSKEDQVFQIFGKFIINGSYALQKSQSIAFGTRFEVRDLKNEVISYINVERQWSEDKQVLTQGEGFIREPKGLLKKRWLAATFSDQFHRQEKSSGDKPFLRFFTQLAVEIFQNEPETELRISTKSSDADVLVAAGFKSISGSGQQIQEGIKSARQTGHVFPDRTDYGAMTFTLKKEGDRLIGENDEEAKVDFSMNQPPISWSKVIEEDSVFKRPGPILPQFFSRDFSLLEE